MSIGFWGSDPSEADGSEPQVRWSWLPVRRRRRQRVLLLLDPGDDKAITSRLLAASDPEAGIVTVHPTTGMSSNVALAHDILASLGRSMHRLAQQRVGSERPAWLAVTSWIVADDIRRVIVLRAHLLSPQGWNALIELWHRTGVQLVLVCHNTSEHEATARLPAGIVPRRVVRVGQVTRVPQGRRARRPLGTTVHPLPPVPDTDVVSFRAEAFRRFARPEFAHIDAVYQQGMAAACRWLASAPGPVTHTGNPVLPQLFPRGMRGSTLAAGVEVIGQRYSESELRTLVSGLLCGSGSHIERKLPEQFEDSEQVHRFVTGLVTDAPTAAHTITLLRGAQAGALLHGVLLELPADLVDGTGLGLTGVPITVERAAAIRAGMANPIHAAALACALFTAFEPGELLRITVDAVVEHGAVLRWNTASRHTSPDWCVLTVPTLARPFLLAALTHARLRGIAPEKSLFKGSGGLTGTQIPDIALTAGITLPVADPVTSRWWRTVRAWHVSEPLHRAPEH